MSVTIRDNWTRSDWPIGVDTGAAARALVPAWSAPPVLAQGACRRRRPPLPEGTALFQAFDLDRDGEQWQQTGALLERVGLPNALELWEAAVLEEGAINRRLHARQISMPCSVASWRW